MEVKAWKKKMRDGEQWRLVVEEAKAGITYTRKRKTLNFSVLLHNIYDALLRVTHVSFTVEDIKADTLVLGNGV
jgi:hypothetical protein